MAKPWPANDSLVPRVGREGECERAWGARGASTVRRRAVPSRRRGSDAKDWREKRGWQAAGARANARPQNRRIARRELHGGCGFEHGDGVSGQGCRWLSQSRGRPRREGVVRMGRRGAVVAVTMKRGLEVGLMTVHFVRGLQQHVRANDRAMRKRGQKAQDRDCSKDVTGASHGAADHTSARLARKAWRPWFRRPFCGGSPRPGGRAMVWE